jgi:DNA topoisomerase IA
MEKLKEITIGRVQSVSVRLIVERRDIQNFNAVASYSVVVAFKETRRKERCKAPEFQ